MCYVGPWTPSQTGALAPALKLVAVSPSCAVSSEFVAPDTLLTHGTGMFGVWKEGSDRSVSLRDSPPWNPQTKTLFALSVISLAVRRAPNMLRTSVAPSVLVRVRPLWTLLTWAACWAMSCQKTWAEDTVWMLGACPIWLGGTMCLTTSFLHGFLRWAESPRMCTMALLCSVGQSAGKSAMPVHVLTRWRRLALGSSSRLLIV